MSNKIQKKWDKCKHRKTQCLKCGSHNIHLDHSLTKKLFTYRLECFNCHWCGKQAMTINGAIRKWNKEYYQKLRKYYAD